MQAQPTTTGSQTQACIEALVRALGPECVLQGERLACRQLADWSGLPHSEPAALVLPRTTKEVSLALQICNAHHRPLAVQGGLTGLAGGANAQPGEIALSMARLNAIEDIDVVGGTALVQAGVTLEALQDAIAAHGLAFPLDLGARGSCQVGGNAATNAGGNRVLRYGTMRNLVRGMEVVLADGTTLDMLDRVIKNNAGFDLKQLFIGSEGTLGVITRLVVALVPLAAARRTVMCAVDDFPAAVALLAQARRCLPELSAFELMWSDYLEAACVALARPRPLSQAYPMYVLIETQGEDSPCAAEALERFLEQSFERGTVRDAIVAQSEAQAQDLWAFREAVSELLSHIKPCAAFDVSVALSRMDALVERLRARLAAEFPGQQHLFFGHLGDGNLHLVSGPFAQAHELDRAEELVYAYVREFRGSISAEHGIGIVKRDFLHHSRSDSEVAVMRGLKRLLDPARILNRDRVFSSAI